ncbi:MAG: nickel-binding protein, partial [Gemmatimonadota bacterium]
MRKFVIEREVPGVGGSSSDQFCEIARTSNGAPGDVGSGIQRVHPYVADDKTFCVYLADDEDRIMEHAR